MKIVLLVCYLIVLTAGYALRFPRMLDGVRTDKAPEDVFNRILWRAMKGTAEPYPEWAVSGVDND